MFQFVNLYKQILYKNSKTKTIQKVKQILHVQGKVVLIKVGL